MACRNRLCTNDVLYVRPRAVAGTAAVATATTRGVTATATARAAAGVAARSPCCRCTSYVATPYLAPRTTAVATAVATAGVAARRPVAHRGSRLWRSGRSRLWRSGRSRLWRSGRSRLWWSRVLGIRAEGSERDRRCWLQRLNM